MMFNEARHWANFLAERMILPTWFDHLEWSFSCKEVQFKTSCPPLRTSCTSAESVIETPVYTNYAMLSNDQYAMECPSHLYMCCITILYHVMENTMANTINPAHKYGKVGCNTTEYTTAFLYSDWLYLLWLVINVHTHVSLLASGFQTLPKASLKFYVKRSLKVQCIPNDAKD